MAINDSCKGCEYEMFSVDTQPCASCVGFDLRIARVQLDSEKEHESEPNVSGETTNLDRIAGALERIANAFDSAEGEE